MKILVQVILTALFAYALGLFLPWWTVAVAGLLVAFLSGNMPFISFISGFISIFLLWGILAWIISGNNQHILAHRMSKVILKQDSPELLLLVTAFLGGLLGGISGWAGSALRQLLKPVSSE